MKLQLLKRTGLAFLLMVITLTSPAQTLSFGNDSTITGFDSLAFVTNVSHLDEFISRFNGESYRADKPELKRNRADGILLLFDGERLKNAGDSALVAARTFCDRVVSDSILLDKHLGNWYVEATCTGLMNRQKVEFKLFLSMEPRPNYGYKWVLTGAEGDLFKTSRHQNVAGLYLSATDHELQFMSLKRVTRDLYEYIDEYTSDSYRADPLSTFLTLVRTGQLKITHVNRLDYHFMDVPGYAFTVSKVRRLTLNSGWLITGFRPCDEFEKQTILFKVGKK